MDPPLIKGDVETINAFGNVGIAGFKAILKGFYQREIIGVGHVAVLLKLNSMWANTVKRKFVGPVAKIGRFFGLLRVGLDTDAVDLQPNAVGPAVDQAKPQLVALLG